MLFKLYKYDMKSIIRQILPVWILAPVLSVVFGFACVSSREEYEMSLDGTAEFFIGDNIFPLIIGLSLFGVFVAIGVITILFVILRFWRGILGDEGYLMHTLPVKTGDLIVSKLLSALTIGGLTIIDGFISIMCMVAVFEGGLFALKLTLDMFLGEMKETLGDFFATFIILMGISLIINIIANIYQVYVSMSLGQLFGVRRIAASVIVYMGITVMLNTISALWLLIVAAMGFEDDISTTIMRISSPSGMINGFIVSIVSSVILIIVFHVITSVILKKKLNLV